MSDTTERDPRDFEDDEDDYSVECCYACGALITASDGACWCDDDEPCGEERRDA